MSPSGDALANIAALIDDGGQITIGQLYPIECAAIANDDHNCLAMLQRRPDESLRDLLVRLDAAIATAWNEEIRAGPGNLNRAISEKAAPLGEDRAQDLRSRKDE